MRAPALLAFAAAAALAAGCSGPAARPDPETAPVPVTTPGPIVGEGSIYSAQRSFALFEDAKARNVGDLVTILLVERTQAQKSAETSTNKSSSLDITDVQIFGRSIGMDTGVGGSRSSTGGGESTQSNRLDGSVTAVVTARLPNGLLQVRGEKQLALNQGSETVFIEGLVRPIDIAPNNTVSSDRVANAHVSYKGRGALNDANAQGWLARFFNSPWFPF